MRMIGCLLLPGRAKIPRRPWEGDVLVARAEEGVSYGRSGIYE
jgi:hypothetical protein